MPTSDPIIETLTASTDLLGDLVNTFTERNEAEPGSAWVEGWFARKASDRRAGDLSAPVIVGAVPATLASELGDGSACVCEARRLLALRVRYFRGFRAHADAVDCTADLTVVDGHNSAGKTSLAESLEWLFTGQLIRRSLRDLGNPRELEGCITNIFRPKDDVTWVEADLELRDGSLLKLRRELKQDYGAATTEKCTSTLLADGRRLEDGEETHLLARLFGGQPPILMQHTLRLFVFSAPGDRRRYFEQLLQLDQLTELIERAVITDAKLASFQNGTDDASTLRWKRLKDGLPKRAAGFRTVERSEPAAFGRALEDHLLRLARTEFGENVEADSTVADVRAGIEEAQGASRQASFPLLAALRPKRAVDPELAVELGEARIRGPFGALRKAEERWQSAREAAKDLDDAQLAVARATSILVNAGLIDVAIAGAQDCPVCRFDGAQSLSRPRVNQILAIEPARVAIAECEERMLSEADGLVVAIDSLESLRQRILPDAPPNAAWDASLEKSTDVIASVAQAVRVFQLEVAERTDRFRTHIDAIREAIKSGKPAAFMEEDVEKVRAALPEIAESAASYASLVKDLGLSRA